MTTLPERLLSEASFWSDWPKDGGDIYVRPDGAADMAALLREAAQALQAAPEGGELLKGKVTFARLGIVTMHVDQSYFGDHMVGDGDDVLIYNVTRAAASSPSAALQAGEV